MNDEFLLGAYDDRDPADADPLRTFDPTPEPGPQWAADGVHPTTHQGGNTGPTTEAHACETAVAMARRGFLNVRVLRRETPTSPWLQVNYPLPGRLVPVNARPYSVIRGRH